MRVAFWTVLVLTTSLLAGCSDAPSDADTQGTPTTTDGPDPTNAAPPMEPVTVSRDLYMTAERTLAAAPPSSAGSLPVGGTTAEVFVGPWDVLTFRSEPLGAPALVAGTVTAEVWFQATQPHINYGLSDFAFWGPASSTLSTSQVQNNMGPQAPGGPFAVTFTLALDHAAPVYIPAGGHLQFQVGAFSSQGDVDGLHVLVGPETPSHANVTWALLPDDPLAGRSWMQQEGFAGRHDTGSVYGVGTSTTEHELTVPTNITGLRLTSSGYGTATRADVDMRLYDGGEMVLRTAAPRSSEQIWLAGPTLEPYLGKTLRLDVTSFVGDSVEYDVIVETAS